MDGILFFKEYLSDDKVLKHSNFRDVYLPEIIELLNDEENYIKIEAIEILTDILHLLDENMIEQDFLPVVFNTMNS